MGNFVDIIEKPFELISKPFDFIGDIFGTSKDIISKSSLSSVYLCFGCLILLLSSSLTLNTTVKSIIVGIYILLGVVLLFGNVIRKRMGFFTVQQQKVFQNKLLKKKEIQKKQENFVVAHNTKEEEHSEEFMKMINTNPDTVSTIYKDSFEYPNNRKQFAQWVYGPSKADRFTGS